tara:strand:- start:771 stop:5261 length:4491 start_codon:yes stop_codon:yes gene_type:complete
MDESKKPQIRPFLQGALDKDPLDRTFLEKLAVSIYGPGIEARADANKPSAVLDDAYRDFVLELPAEVQADVDRYLNIFRNDPTPVIQFLDEYKKEGYSDYFKDSKNFTDIADKKDLGRFADFNFLGKGSYDALYRKDETGDKARKKVMESKLTQAVIGPGQGLYTAVRGTAETISALSDLYLDTETLDNVQKALPEMSLDDIYGEDAGGVAKFTSLLTQYGTGFAVAQKIAKKLFGNVAKTKLAKKAAAVAATNKAANYGVNLAKYGGYWVLPAFAADTTVSATGQKSVGEIFGDESGNFLERALANTKLESLEGITDPKEYAAAVLRNKLKFGTEGTAFLGALKLVGPSVKTLSTGSGVILSNVVDPAITGMTKVLASTKTGIPQLFRGVSKVADKALTKSGIPRSDLWKYSEYGAGVKSSILRAIDQFVQNFKSGGPFNVQTRNELKKLDGLNKSAKKSTDIFLKDLDRQMYKLADAGFNDILFNTNTANQALRYWSDVLEYMRGNIKLNKLPESLRPSSFAVRKLIDDYTLELSPILKTMNVKDDIIKNMGRYLHQGYEIFKNNRYRAPKEEYNAAINYFTKLQKSFNKNISPSDAKVEATAMVNRILAIGRSEGSTPAQRLKAIANAAQELNIPKSTFNKFFGDEQTLPDAIAKLLGRVEDPKQIIMDTIVEMAHTANSFKAYREIAEFGIDNFIFRNRRQYIDFAKKNGITSPRDLVEIKVSKPYNLDLQKIFKTGKEPMLTLPEIAKAMKDNTLIMDQLLKLPFMKSALAIKAGIQMNKTVLSLMTQMRNITTAAMFATANGHVGSGASVADNFRILFDDLVGKTKDPKKLKEILEEALDNGAIDSSTIAQELEQMIPELMGGSKLGGKTVIQGTTSDNIFAHLFSNKGAMGRVVGKSMEAYQLGDNLWKLFGYNYVKSQLTPALRNLDDVKKYFRQVYKYDFKPTRADGTKKSLSDAIKEISGIEIRDTYPNYSMIPTFVQNVRKFPFAGNFVAFVSEMYRNSFNIVRGGMRKMQSDNPYIRQIGARQLIGWMTTVGIATPVVLDSAQKMTGITEEMYNAYKDRFAPPYEKASDLIPVTKQNEDRSWKASNFSYLVPYNDVAAPFKAAIQKFRQGKDTDQDTADLFALSAKAFVVRSLEPFLAPSIMAETALELTPDSKGIFRNKNGGVIADMKNDPDWFSKIMYHAYRKVTPTTIRSAEEISQAIGGDLSKSAIKRDLFDTVLKVFTGFSITKQDPRTSMRFKLGTYSGLLSDARGAFTNDVNAANKLQRDARLILRGLDAETIVSEYDKLQSNNYRILSEVYKDVQALRTLNFTEAEIRDMLSGRRALSEEDVNMVMLGTFNPENLPNFKEDSAIQNTIKNINRELKTNLTVNDFVDQIKLGEIQQKYTAIPLGLSEKDREEFFKSTIDRKIKELDPKIEENIKILEEQLKDQESKVQPVVPAAPFLPDPQIANMFAANINPTTGLTQTESALLSPEEQIIAQRLKT